MYIYEQYQHSVNMYVCTYSMYLCNCLLLPWQQGQYTRSLFGIPTPDVIHHRMWLIRNDHFAPANYTQWLTVDMYCHLYAWSQSRNERSTCSY